MTPVGLDTETCLIAPGRLAPDLVCVSWAGEGDRGVLDHMHAYPFVHELLEGPYLILGLNIAYDMAVLANAYPDLLDAVFAKYARGQVRDVGLDQRLVDIAHGKIKLYDKRKGAYSLAGLCKRVLGVDLEKEDTPRLEYGALRGVPVEAYTPEQIKYAELDAIYPEQIHAKHLQVDATWQARCRGVGLFSDAPTQARHAFSLHLLSCWGVRSNEARCRALVRSLEQDIDECRALLQDEGLVRGNGTRNIKAAQERMRQVMAAKGRKPLLTEKGGVKLDQEATDASGDPVLRAYTRFVGANGLRQKVRDLWKGAYMPLQPAYRSVMDTGRTSSRKPSPPLAGFQIQNPPRVGGARECLEPRPGTIFIDADFSTAEVHSLAQTLLEMYGASPLAALLNSGRDMHVYVAAKLLGKTYEEVDQAPKAQRKEWRNYAKAYVFGVPGGLGVTTFVSWSAATYGVHLSEKKASEDMAMFKQVLFPDVGRYLQDVSYHLQSSDTVIYDWSQRWRGGLTYTNCANGFFQARTADAALASLDEVLRLAYTVPASPLYGCRFHGFIHDEIRGEAPVERAAAAAEELGRVMAQVYNTFVPGVPTTADPGLCWRWSKGNDPARDSQGVLVPSDPENAPDWYQGAWHE